MSKTYYRVEDIRPCSIGFALSRCELIVRDFRVLRETPKGVWLDMECTKPRFVLHGAKKKFACQSPADAMESFIARKRRQKAILTSQLSHVDEALELALKLKGARA